MQLTNLHYQCPICKQAYGRKATAECCVSYPLKGPPAIVEGDQIILKKSSKWLRVQKIKITSLITGVGKEQPHEIWVLAADDSQKYRDWYGPNDYVHYPFSGINALVTHRKIKI